jgi:hypothetical protein
MASPVTTAGSFTCTHGGSPTLTSDAKLTVNGKPVVPFAAATTLGTYTGCTFTNGPCTTTAVVSGGAATKLTVDGKPALLDSIEANAGAPATAASVTAAAGQKKLTAE